MWCQDARHVADVARVAARRLATLLADGVDLGKVVQLLLERSGKRFIYVANELRRLEDVRFFVLEIPLGWTSCKRRRFHMPG